MRELLKPRDLQYNLRNKNTLDILKVTTTSYGIEKVQFIGQKLWLMLHPNAREFPSLMAFKKNLNPAQQCMIIDCVKYLYLGFVSFNFVPFSLFYLVYPLIFILIVGLK